MTLPYAAFFLTLALAVMPRPGLAQATPLFDGVSGGDARIAEQMATLTDTLRIAEVLAVMRDEGLVYGKTLQEDLLAGQGGARWQGIVGEVYDPARTRPRFEAVLAAALSPDAQTGGATDGDPATKSADLDQMIGFFASDLGQTILDLEIEARRALLETSVEEAAKVAVEDMIAASDPRMQQLRRFAEANDLIEANVMGALNANLGFYQGMVAGGAFGGGMTESDMLAEVWGQEAEIRAETEDWLFPYLALAYQPLSDADLDAYVAFSESPAGQRLNSALFAAFDAIFVTISNDLGRAAARQIGGQDI